MIKKIIKELKRFCMIIVYKKKKVSLKHGVCLSHKNEFEGYNVIGSGTLLFNTQIGYGSYIGKDCNFINTRIGRYCSIASNVKTVVATHPTNTFVSTHPAFFSTLKQAGFTYVEDQLFEEIKYINK